MITYGTPAANTTPRAVRLKQIYFIITRRCNLSCAHCIRDSGPSIRDYLSLEEAEAALLKLAPHGQDSLLLLSGGEPALHPAFQGIVSRSCQLFPRVMVNTNGLLLNTLEHATRQNPGLRLQISLDGDTVAHEQVRGRNTFEPTLQNIRRLAEQGVRITVASTVSRRNIATLRALDAALAEIPFALWTLKREVAYGRAGDGTHDVATDEWNQLAAEVAAGFGNRRRILIQPMFALESFATGATFDGADPDWRNCGTGRSKLYINPDLTVFPCACLEELNMGDLRREPIQAILDRIGSLPVEPGEASPCGHCPVLQQCMGGCPGASLRTYGSFGIGDPRCPAISDLVGEGTC